MERKQIEINIEADELVTGVFQSAVTRLLIWDSTTPDKDNKFARALKRIEFCPAEKSKNHLDVEDDAGSDPELTCRRRISRTMVNFKDPSIDKSDAVHDAEESDEEVTRL